MRGSDVDTVRYKLIGSCLMVTMPDNNEIPIICPRCQNANKPNAKPMIEINNGTITCVGCGHTWPLKPRPDAA